MSEQPDLPTWAQSAPGFVQRLLRQPIDSPQRTVATAVGLCFVCSILVSAAAVALRPIQEVNQLRDKQRNILEVAGLMREDASIEELFADVEPRIVELETGRFTDAVEPASYDDRLALSDPELSNALEPSEDPASIRRKALYRTVYLVRDEAGEVSKIVAPIRGYGLWSTLYGFVAIAPDGNEILGLQFYEHAETPGLGGEVDNPDWRAQWRGKRLYDDEGEIAISVLKGDQSDNPHGVDSLAGATLTARGVHNLIRYWASEDGYGPFFENLDEELANG